MDYIVSNALSTLHISSKKWKGLDEFFIFESLREYGILISKFLWWEFLDSGLELLGA